MNNKRSYISRSDNRRGSARIEMAIAGSVVVEQWLKRLLVRIDIKAKVFGENSRGKKMSW